MEQHHVYEITTGNSKKNIEEVTNALDRNAEMQDKVREEAEKTIKTFDQMFSGAGRDSSSGYEENLRRTKAYLEQLKEAAAKFGKEMNDIITKGGDIGKMPYLQELYRRINKEIKEEEEVVQELTKALAEKNAEEKKSEDQGKKDEGQSKKTTEATKSLRTQMRLLKEQLTEMRLAGEEGTDKFKELEEELARLATANNETTKAMQADSTGATQWHGMIEGVQGLMGAYSAASGVVGLFTKDQEKLMAVQTKMQSTMAALMGMQQLANTLHSTSTFRLRTLTSIQTAYGKVIQGVTKFTKLFTASEVAATVAAKGLTAVLTGGLSLLAGAGIIALNKYKKKQEETNQSIKTAAEMGASNVAAVKDLSARYRDLGDSLEEKKKFITQNKNELDKLGVAVNDVNDADKLLIDRTDEYIAAQMKRAQAAAARSKAEEIAGKWLEKQLKLETFDENDDGWETVNLGAEFDEAYENMGESVTVRVRSAKGKVEDEANELENEMNHLYDLAAGFDKKAKEILDGAELDSAEDDADDERRNWESVFKTVTQNYEKFKSESEKEKQQFDEKYADDELKRIELRKQQQIEALDKAYKELHDSMTSIGLDTDGLDEIYNNRLGLINSDAAKQSEAYIKAQKEKSLKNLMDLADEYAGYIKRRKNIEKEYAEAYAAMFNADGSLKQELLDQNYDGESILENLNRNRDEALEALDEEIASRSEHFQNWCNRIAEASIDELLSMIAEAEAAINEIELDSDADPEAYAVAKNELKKATEGLKEATENNLSPNKRSVQEWEALENVLNNCIATFKEIGQQVGGVVGEIIELAGTIAGDTVKIVNDIIKLTDTSTNATKGTAEAASAAIGAVEKASAILAIISAALSIINAVKDAINSESEAAQAATLANEEYRRSLVKLANSRAIEAFSNAFGTDSIGQFKEYADQVNEAKKALDELTSAEYTSKVNKGIMKMSRGWKMLDPLTAVVTTTVFDLNTEQMEGIVADTRKKWDKFWGRKKDKIQVLDLSSMIDDEGVLDGDQLKAWYDAYGSKLSAANKAAVEAMIEQWEEYQEALEAMSEYISDLFGTIADDIADSMIEAFEESGDAAIDFAEISSEMAKTVAKSWAKSLLTREVFNEELEEEVKDLLASDNAQGAIDRMAEAIQDAGEYSSQITEFLRGVGVLSDVAERTSTAAGIAQASQDSVDELNGRMTAVQGLTFNIAENTRSLVEQCSSILNVLFRIDSNTERLYAIESDMAVVRSAVTEISDRGVTIRS